MSPPTNHGVAEVLADPIVQLMMRADGVDCRTLAKELHGVARRLREKRPPATMRKTKTTPPGRLACRLLRHRTSETHRFRRSPLPVIGFFIHETDLRLGDRHHHGACRGSLLFPVADLAIPRHHAAAGRGQRQYPGASAQVVADTVTTPLEEQINGVAGMTYMSSSSSNDGSSTITITFDVGYPLSIAAVDVQNRVSQAASSLPAIVNQGGVTIKKQNPNFVLIVNLTSPDHSVDPVTLSNYAYLQIADPLKRLQGVGDVQIFGERRYSMRIWLDPDKLANLGITAVDVQNAIAEQNIQVAAGKIGASPCAERYGV